MQRNQFNQQHQYNDTFYTPSVGVPNALLEFKNTQMQE